MKVIITTVGTSLLSNLIRRENAKGFRFNISEDDIEDIANGLLEGEFSELPEYCKTIILASDQSIKRICFDEIYQLNLNASAEIKSICKIATGTPATVYLLATDTFMSEYAAEQITKHLNARNNLEVINKGRIKNLTIDDPELFEQSGFEELLNKLEEIRGKHKGDDIILNISGGYKALIPFLSIYAQLQDIPLKYIYESSSDVISISSANLNFDWTLMEALRPYLVEKINPSDLGEDSNQIINALKDNHLILKNHKEDGLHILSPLGRLLVNSFHDNTNLKNKILGTFLEYKYFEFFTSSDVKSRVSVNEFDLPYSYQFSQDKQTFVNDFSSQNTFEYKSKAGDIDLILFEEQQVTLVEVKNFHTLLSYRKLIGNYRPEAEKNDEDYYRKIKAKIEAFEYKTQKLPFKFLFLINVILFERDHREYQEEPALREVLNYFRDAISKDFCNKVAFEARICRFNYVDKKKLKVNYDKLLRTPIKESDFRNIEFIQKN